MVTAEPELPKGGAVRTQLVGGHPFRREALFSQELAHELDGRESGEDAGGGDGSRGGGPGNQMKTPCRACAFLPGGRERLHPARGGERERLEREG